MRTGTGPCSAGSSTSRRTRTGSDLILFYEYFHGDNGAGLGASHQTGWTGTVATLLRILRRMTTIYEINTAVWLGGRTFAEADWDCAAARTSTPSG